MSTFTTGTAIPAQTVATQSTNLSSLPDWYSNYAKDIIDTQAQQSMTPYAAYNGPRVAGFTPLQEQAYTSLPGAVTAYQPGLQQAQQVAQGAVGMSGLAAAQPYLQNAGQTSVSQVGQYMNPYTDQVVNRIGQIGARTLNEQLLPGIRDKFIAGGSYGGSRNAEMFGRSLRDTYESTLAKQAEALQTGYNTSLTTAGSDLTRQSQLAQTAGQLGGADVEAQQKSATQLASLAGQQQQLGLTGVGALQAAGAQQQQLGQQNLDVAYQDFLRQQGYNQTQIDAMTKTTGALAGALPKYTEAAGISPSGTTPTFTQSGLETATQIATAVAAAVAQYGPGVAKFFAGL